MCISEVNNTGDSGDFEALRNRYTDTAEAIKGILYDNDGSEDDVIDGGEDTYANIDGEIHALEVK